MSVRNLPPFARAAKVAAEPCTLLESIVKRQLGVR